VADALLDDFSDMRRLVQQWYEAGATPAPTDGPAASQRAGRSAP
jgi:hypothetical protein